MYPSKLLIPLGFTLASGAGLLGTHQAHCDHEGAIFEDTVSGGGHHSAAEAEAERLVQAIKEEAEQRART